MQIERKVADQLAAPVLLVYKEKIELATSQRKRERKISYTRKMQLVRASPLSVAATPYYIASVCYMQMDKFIQSR